MPHLDTPSPLNLDDEDDEEHETVRTVGWPEGVRFPHIHNGSYPICRPHGSLKMFKLFVGPSLDDDQHALLDSVLDSYLQRNVQLEYPILCFTTYRSALSVARSRSILELLGARVETYLEFRVIQPDRNIEMTTRMDTEFGGRTISSFLSGPADILSEPDEVRRARRLHSLSVIHILPPTQPIPGFDTPEIRTSCVSGLMEILSSAGSLRKCILPLDLQSQISDCLDILSRCPHMEQLELLPPEMFNLYDLLQSSSPTSTAYMDSLARSLAAITSLQELRLPIHLLTPDLLICVASLQNLMILKIIPDPNVNSVDLLVTAMNAAGLIGQAPNSFERLAWLHLGPDNGLRVPLENINWNDNHQTLSQMLPKTIIDWP